MKNVVSLELMLTVLADFGLQLCILFILAVSEDSDAAYAVTPPAPEPPGPQSVATRLEVDEQGMLFVDRQLFGRLSQEEAFRARLRDRVAGSPPGHVLLRLRTTEPIRTWIDLVPALGEREVRLQPTTTGKR